MYFVAVTDSWWADDGNRNTRCVEVVQDQEQLNWTLVDGVYQFEKLSSALKLASQLSRQYAAPICHDK